MDIDKIKLYLNDLVQVLNKKGKIFWYDINAIPFKPLVSSSNEKDAYIKIEKLIKEMDYNDDLVKIKIIIYKDNVDEIKKLDRSGGPIGVQCSVYEVDNGIISDVPSKKRIKTIWYTNEELYNRKFHVRDLEKIANIVYNKQINLSPLKINTIKDIDEIIKNQKIEK